MERGTVGRWSNAGLGSRMDTQVCFVCTDVVVRG